MIGPSICSTSHRRHHHTPACARQYWTGPSAPLFNSHHVYPLTSATTSHARPPAFATHNMVRSLERRRACQARRGAREYCDDGHVSRLRDTFACCLECV